MRNYDLEDIVECLTAEGFAKEVYLLAWHTPKGKVSVSELHQSLPGISNAYELLVVTDCENKDEMTEFYEMACAHIKPIKIISTHILAEEENAPKIQLSYLS